MQANTHTLTAIFGNQVRYVVPLFQRPYVWTQEEQWEPLWSDVRVVAERLLDQPAGYAAQQVPPHFLGAIVLDQPMHQTGFVAVRNVIDGQQRLTTLQLLLDAAQLVAERYKVEMDSNALRVLVLNQPAILQHPDERFKVWPTERDQDAFRAAMDNGATVPTELADAAVAKAHAFFIRSIETWVATAGSSESATAQLGSLTRTLRDLLKIVVIDLDHGDNAQVIFETLNHRGAPLLAADLIKNLVFQTAQERGVNVEALYKRHWRQLDTDYWRRRIARGRQFVPRIDIFINHWLVMKLLDEVQSDRIFVEFRDYLRSQQPDVEALLQELARDADTYASLETLAGAAVARFYYRVVVALDSAVVMPILLWLTRWPDDSLSTAQRDKALAALESWLIRRALCRLTSKDVNRIVLDLLKELSSAGSQSAGDVTESYLARQQADSRLWPTDDMVRDSLRDAPLYKALLRGRLRMLLEAIEDQRRTIMSEHGASPRNLTIEHVMPRAWREHWAMDVVSPAAADRRDTLIHTIGNLTLVNKRLNPSLSNRPWTAAAAKERGFNDGGKRDALLRHSTLKINADIVSKNLTIWDETSIESRTTALTELILRIWPRPIAEITQIDLSMAEREPDLPEAELSQDDEPLSYATTYQPLIDWLKDQASDELSVNFDELEVALGFALPPSARSHLQYWYSAQSALGRAIAAGGFRPTGVNLTDERATLVRHRSDDHAVPDSDNEPN